MFVAFLCATNVHHAFVHAIKFNAPFFGHSRQMLPSSNRQLGGVNGVRFIVTHGVQKLSKPTVFVPAGRQAEFEWRILFKQPLHAFQDSARMMPGFCVTRRQLTAIGITRVHASISFTID